MKVIGVLKSGTKGVRVLVDKIDDRLRQGCYVFGSNELGDFMWKCSHFILVENAIVIVPEEGDPLPQLDEELRVEGHVSMSAELCVTYAGKKKVMLSKKSGTVYEDVISICHERFAKHLRRLVNSRVRVTITEIES